jgi:hypothetical protein
MIKLPNTIRIGVCVRQRIDLPDGAGLMVGADHEACGTAVIEDASVDKELLVGACPGETVII